MTEAARVESIHYGSKGAKCPFSGRPYFMHIEHPELGQVPTYGGPYSSYTVPVPGSDSCAPLREGELHCERYDHEAGCWSEGGEGTRLYVVQMEALHSLEKRVEQAELWRKAVVAACMPTEACFDGSDPEKTISNLIDWHLQKSHVTLRPHVAPSTGADAQAAGVSMASLDPPPHDHLAGGPDPLMAEAEEIVRSGGKPSISYLQRKLRIGYNRTARLLESLEKLEVVSAMDARGARVVLERKP